MAAGVLPGGKVEAVQRFRAAHGPVAFVGDGINDAPALAEADVGLAIGTGTDIAMESADVVLMSGDLDALVEALALSRAVMANIRQNLFWAFAYNAALIPVAAGVLVPFGGPRPVADPGGGRHGVLERLRPRQRPAAAPGGRADRPARRARARRRGRHERGRS